LAEEQIVTMSVREAPEFRYKSCLKSVPVAENILTGVKVLKVNPAGKLKAAFLTLSEDRFILCVTPSKIKRFLGRTGPLRPILKRVATDDELEYEHTIDVGSITRIQRGHNTLRFELARKLKNKISPPKRNKQEVPEHDPSQCFSIFIVGGRTIDLMINDEESDRDEVVSALEELIMTYTEAKETVGNDIQLLRYIWLDVDKDKSNTINSSEFANILNRINFSMTRSESNGHYEKFTKVIGLSKSERRMGLSFEQCATILHKVKRDSGWMVQPVKQIFMDLFGEYMHNGKMRERVSSESFLKKFMLKKQGESNMTMEDVEKLFYKLNALEVAFVPSNPKLKESERGKHIDRDRFEAYLVSKENDVFDPAKEKFDATIMNKPLSEFWINSSHNTYLTGDQWKSMSSVEMYMNVLYSGCRCLELDCWDGERDSETQTPIPIIFHGHTITSRILFRDVIQAIKVFLNGNPYCYPIVLSIENHCTPPFQDAMARCMIDIFGDSLFVPNDDSLQISIPSAESLKGKVVIKGKRLTEALDLQETDLESESDDDSVVTADHAISDVVPLKKKVAISGIAPDLSKITYFHSCRVDDFGKSKKKAPNNMHSFSESKARNYAKKRDQRDNWISFNKTHMTRVYPSGKRVDSSNYSPITGWSTGCQLVALNHQNPDAKRRLNDGRFRENGQCGYVLKPQLLKRDDASNLQSIHVKVISGYCLPKPKGKKRGECIDPYVQVSLYDIPVQGGKEFVMSYNTNQVNNNGFNPIWKQPGDFSFKVHNFDVAMLQFSVWDRDYTNPDDFIASSSVPVTCIREGYRSVKLFDAKNTRSGPFENAYLLIEVKMKRGEDLDLRMA